MISKRRGFLASAVSVLTLGMMPAQAQTPESLDWVNAEDEEDVYADAQSGAATCDKSKEFDGYTIRLSLAKDVVSARIQFHDSGLELKFKTEPSTGGVAEFLASGGLLRHIAFDGLSISVSRIIDFTDRYLSRHGANTPIVMRISDRASGAEAVLHAKIATEKYIGTFIQSVTMDSHAADQGVFYNLFLRSEGMVISVGGFLGDQMGWMLIGRSSASGRGVMRNLQSLASDFASVIKPVDRSECAQRCFLTTACCEAYGKPDDCYELETLRAFRNGWLRFQPGGAEAIAVYRVVAPQICAALACDPRHDYQLARMYWGTIVPCIALIHVGLSRPAYALYRRLVTRLMARYGIA